MELLQFAYFTRGKASVIGVDPVDEMIDTCSKNLEEAKAENPWFDPSMVELQKGDVLNLPAEDASVDVAAQNCLFNIFHEEDLKRSIEEVYRVLAPHGRLVLSDPVCEEEIPEDLRNDERLRAMCLTGAIPLKDYIQRLTDVGFGTIEVRAKRPYRVLGPQQYDVDAPIRIESVEVCAIKDPMPSDGPCVFTGRTAIYHGKEEYFDDGKGHTLMPNQPLAVCDKTAADLEALGRDDIYVSGSTYFYDGGGCC